LAGLSGFIEKEAQMKYHHTNDQAAEYLRLVLRELGRYNLAATPFNYSVWYEYLSKVNPELTLALKEHLSKSDDITDEVAYQLYLYHIVNRGQAMVDKVKVNFLDVVKEIMNDLSSTGEDISGFEKYLMKFSTRIEKADSESGFKSSLKDLIIEVKKIENSSMMLEDRLKSADEEVKVLQFKLKETEWFATTDALTGLLNRRSFEEKLLQYIAISNNDSQMLSLIMLDIDHFKRVNDTYGHLTGDDLLRVIAKTLKDYVRGKDIVCRYGGEEFVILLSDTPMAGAVTVAEKIRTHFASMSWKQKSTGVSMGKVTLSCGVSQYRVNEPTESFVQRADIALYQSKKMGRNQVTPEMA
jgi:diguanylate cyclase